MLRLPEPMLARAGAIPRGSGWLYEPKLDGYRCMVCTHAGTQGAIASRRLDGDSRAVHDQRVTRPDYVEYLRSDKWLRVRSAAFKDAGGRCERCGGRATLVHHLTYERLGAERPSDTQALCDRCHAEAHGLPWPPVESSRTEERDGKTFMLNVLPPAPEPRDSWARHTTHRRRKRIVRN